MEMKDKYIQQLEDKSKYYEILDMITDLLEDVGKWPEFRNHAEGYREMVNDAFKFGRIKWHQKDKLNNLLNLAYKIGNAKQ